MEKKYQIFISSTYKDLIEARSKVRDAILSMMHFPVGMEMFNAADEEQWEIIQETIDSSDYYVLILGQRYGSVIESGSDAGISYTEKEFRYAREKKIPVLVFIIDDDVAIKPEFIEKDPESIKKLADFKTEAKKGRTVQWWTNIDELAREVSESLHQQMDRKKRPGWIRGDAFDIEASHAEILSLNKKIRELEQENAELKSQIVKRVPELMAAVVLDQQDDEEVDGKGLKTHGKLLIDSSDNAIKIQLYHNDGECYKNKYEPLDLSCVESHLKKYVKEKDLQAYNAALPSEEEINDYAHKMGVYKTITNGGVALKLRVLNKGTAKATDIRISIVFPKDIFVYDIDDIEKMKEPKAPKLPPNPIEKAEERFMSDLNPVYGLLKNSMDGMQPFYSARSLPIIDPAIFNNSNSSVFESISIRDNSIFAECNQLPHKDDTEFDGIYIKEKKIQNVEFLGFKAGEELEEIIKGARFTLIPSIWYDNLPNTALESFQYSKPVIASDIGSLPELVLDGVNGYLFKPADARELCEKVALLDNDDVVEKMGAASRARLEDRFAPQTHYNTLMKVFSRVRKEN